MLIEALFYMTREQINTRAKCLIISRELQRDTLAVYSVCNNKLNKHARANNESRIIRHQHHTIIITIANTKCTPQVFPSAG
jgi:hypothetical protein